ncbi:SMI1/KNR4 family protein [Bacillus spongiae]|uniref:SMI1/KNR4 family protein n=1 Tax=Bacillus spongiae TaxID=2683610 RepID=A0ABU8HD98_9BACI
MVDLTKLEMDYNNPPGSNEDIVQIEKLMNTIIPIAFKELLLTSNGFLTTEGVFIYGTEDIVERNKTWEVNQYAHGYIAIGDDSGGRVFLMAADTDSSQVIISDSGDMNLSHADFMTNDLVEWVSRGCTIPE